MNEREKMINGEIYNASDNELVKDRIRAKKICQKYNAMDREDTDDLLKTLKELVSTKGGYLIIEPNFFCDYGYNIEFGKDVFINYNNVFLDCAKITFGDNVFVGPNCGFYTAIHPVKVEERNKFIETVKPITIGNNVWLGGNVVVLPGVTIGDNTTIGAGSVITKNIPSNVVAVGNPCKVIRKIEN